MKRNVWLTKVMVCIAMAMCFSLMSTSQASSPVSSEFVIRAAVEDETMPSIAYNPQRGEYLVVFWNDRPGNDDIRAERVSKNGKLLGGRWVAAGPGAERRYPDVTYNPQAQQYLVAWVEESGGNNFIKGQRLSADAQPVGGQIILVAGNVGLHTPRHPAVAYAYTANKYLVVWEYEVNIPPNPVTTSIIGRVVFADGTPDPGGGITIAQDPGIGALRGPFCYPDLSYNVDRNEYLVVWQARVGPDQNIRARRVTGHGELLFPDFIPVTPYSGDQNKPAVASLTNQGTEGVYLIVWEDVGTNTQIYASWMTGNGTIFGSHFFVLSGIANHNPAIAGSESARNFLVVATREGGAANDIICGQAVSYAGQLVGGEACFGSPTAEYPAVAAGAVGDFLTAWEDKPTSSVETDIYGQFWGNRVYLPMVVRNR